jgi:hypothetical protein
MSREAAKKIVDLMIKHGAEQNAVLAEIQSICADDEFQTYKTNGRTIYGVHVAGCHQSNS